MITHRLARLAVLVSAAVASGVLLTGMLAGCSAQGESTSTTKTVDQSCPSPKTQKLIPTILRTLPHDPTVFTQGLTIFGGALFESAGQYGHSSVRELTLDATLVRESALKPRWFGEGLTVDKQGRLVQLTWREGVAAIWDRTALTLAGKYSYDGEGWGITTLPDGTFVMSNGTDSLTERDARTFKATRTWVVKRADGAVDQLNELDFDGTNLWANRWRTNEIVRIDPVCQQVTAVVDASSLTHAAEQAATGSIDVLNGIASIPGTDHFLVTGKYWPVMFEVTFVPA